MKISSQIKDNGKYLEVTKAQHVEGYKVLVSFSDGKSTTVDFCTFLNASRNPEIRKYLDMKLFLDFKIQDGNLIWNDYDMIFPLEDLYNNDILHVVKEAIV